MTAVFIIFGIVLCLLALAGGCAGIFLFVQYAIEANATKDRNREADALVERIKKLKEEDPDGSITQALSTLGQRQQGRRY